MPFQANEGHRLVDPAGVGVVTDVEPQTPRRRSRARGEIPAGQMPTRLLPIVVRADRVGAEHADLTGRAPAEPFEDFKVAVLPGRGPRKAKISLRCA